MGLKDKGSDQVYVVDHCRWVEFRTPKLLTERRKERNMLVFLFEGDVDSQQFKGSTMT